MPGFDKMGTYQTVDSTDREDESNSQCQSQLDDTNNVKGMFLQNYYFQPFLIYLALGSKCHFLFCLLQILKII